jgi:hypothetical protein
VRSEYPQADIFEVNAAGKVSGVSIFMKTPGSAPPVEGASASDRAVPSDAPATAP